MNEIDERLAEIRAREQAATQSEWQKWHRIAYGEDTFIVTRVPGHPRFTQEADAEFTAHARADVPYLLDLVEQLRMQLGAAQALLLPGMDFVQTMDRALRDWSSYIKSSDEQGGDSDN